VCLLLEELPPLALLSQAFYTNIGTGPLVHATIHSAVETQLAEGHPHAAAALARLLAEGLDRHEAIHAIGSVLTEEIFEVLKSKRAHDPVAYARRLDKLTGAGWRGGS
jgi:hypothetical protein